MRSNTQIAVERSFLSAASSRCSASRRSCSITCCWRRASRLSGSASTFLVLKALIWRALASSAAASFFTSAAKKFRVSVARPARIERFSSRMRLTTSSAARAASRAVGPSIATPITTAPGSGP